MRSAFTLRSRLRSVHVSRSLIVQRSHIVQQLAFSVQPSFTLRSLSVFFSVRSPFVRSSFAHLSSGKVERLRDCIFKFLHMNQLCVKYILLFYIVCRRFRILPCFIVIFHIIYFTTSRQGTPFLGFE